MFKEFEQPENCEYIAPPSPEIGEVVFKFSNIEQGRQERSKSLKWRLSEQIQWGIAGFIFGIFLSLTIEAFRVNSDPEENVPLLFIKVLSFGFIGGIIGFIKGLPLMITYYVGVNGAEWYSGKTVLNINHEILLYDKVSALTVEFEHKKTIIGEPFTEYAYTWYAENSFLSRIYYFSNGYFGKKDSIFIEKKGIVRYQFNTIAEQYYTLNKLEKYINEIKWNGKVTFDLRGGDTFYITKDSLEYEENSNKHSIKFTDIQKEDINDGLLIIPYDNSYKHFELDKMPNEKLFRMLLLLQLEKVLLVNREINNLNFN